MSLKRKTQEYVLTESKIDAAKANISKSASGSYTGNNTVNRAIAHGLGVTPKFVISLKTGEGTSICINVIGNSINGNDSGTETIQAVTMWDATNFYIGNAAHYPHSANQNLKAYTWVALA